MTLSVLARAETAGGLSEEVAFLTPKQIGGAVIRNRLRRRMREIYRRSLGPAKPAFHLVWIARAAASDLTFDELRDCMTALIRRAGVAS